MRNAFHAFLKCSIMYTSLTTQSRAVPKFPSTWKLLGGGHMTIHRHQRRWNRLIANWRENYGCPSWFGQFAILCLAGHGVISAVGKGFSCGSIGTTQRQQAYPSLNSSLNVSLPTFHPPKRCCSSGLCPSVCFLCILEHRTDLVFSLQFL